MNIPDSADREATPDELVRLFISEATQRLTALPVAPRLRCTTRLLHFGERGWEDGASTVITNWFDVTITFSSDAIEGALRFGERENSLWAFAQKAGTADSFALWEWSAALGRVPGAWEGGEWVYHPDRVRAIVAAFCDALLDMHDAIAHAPESVLTQLIAARDARAGEDAEAIRVRNQERDEVQAAAAFRAGDFQTAVTLLRAHDAHLSPAQRRKLELAESKLRNARG